MKKMTLFKIAMSIVFVFFTTTMFAQDMTDLTNHVEYPYAGGTWEDADDDANAIYVTAGAVLPFAVAPDGAYNPSYDFGTDPNTVNGSSWTWQVTNPADVDQGWTITEPLDLSGIVVNANVGRTVDYAALGGDGQVADNFALITAGATPGLFYVKATEANGSCSDATPTEIAVTVFAAPTISIDAAQDDTWDNLLGGEGNCGLLDDQTFQILLTGYQNYRIVFSIDVDNVDAGGALIDELAAYDHDLSLTDVERTSSGTLADNADSPSSYAIADGGTDFGQLTGVPNQDILTVTKDFAVVNNYITQYTYTFTSVNDQISRKSDYWLAGGAAVYSTYTPATTSLTYFVKPTPNTGHIYVIPN